MLEKFSNFSEGIRGNAKFGSFILFNFGKAGMSGILARRDIASSIVFIGAGGFDRNLAAKQYFVWIVNV